jgi:hypothetical protein
MRRFFLSVAAREAKKRKHEILENRLVCILTLQVYFSNYLYLSYLGENAGVSFNKWQLLERPQVILTRMY